MWLWNSLKWYLEWVQKIKWKHISQKCTIVFVSFLDIQKDTQRATGELKWTAVVMETRCTVRLFSLSFPRKTASGSTFFTNRQIQPRLLCIQDIWMLLKKKAFEFRFKSRFEAPVEERQGEWHWKTATRESKRAILSVRQVVFF